MPTRVWLLRHAESAVPNVFHGAESDVGLSDRGTRQVQALAKVLAGYGADGVISSGMRRALLTAGPIAEACAVPLRVEPELHERRVGVPRRGPPEPPPPPGGGNPPPFGTGGTPLAPARAGDVAGIPA